MLCGKQDSWIFQKEVLSESARLAPRDNGSAANSAKTGERLHFRGRRFIISLNRSFCTTGSVINA